MSFLLSFFSFFTVLTHRIDWINDFLTLELHDNVDDYIEMPEARLYINDRRVYDPDMYYIRNGVEWTYISTVNTSIVKAYTIKYRVYFPTYSISQVKTITFNVVDIIAPTFHHIPNYKIPLNQKLPDLDSNIVYSDNYYKLEELSLNIDTTKIVLNRIGNYPIEYRISDPSGNVTIKTGYLEVYDHLPPEIKLKKELILPYNTIFVWQDYLSIIDNYDLVLQIDIDDSQVDYSKLGVYPISVTATDQSGLSETIIQDLTIIDNEKPQLILKSQPPPIEVFSNLSDSELKSYIIDINDNYDDLSIDDVIVTHDIEYDVLGYYYIYYRVSDYSNNILDTKIKVQVVDQTKPEIWLNEPLVFNVFDPIPFLDTYIDYSDNYTHKDQLILKITASFKMNIVGKSIVTFEVSDTSKNKTTYHTYIEIVDITPPELYQINDIIITDFQKKLLSSFFNYEDNYDVKSNLKLDINDQDIDYEKIGSYPLYVTVTDTSGNVIQLSSEIIVIDIIEPTLLLKQSAVQIQIGNEPLDLYSYIYQAYDNYDNLTIDDVVINHQIDYDTIGVYEVLYTLSDQSQNMSQQILYVSIDDRIAPWISGPPVSMTMHEFFNPLDGIEAGDNLNDYEITFFPKTIDTSTPGDKTITYVITDSRGNYTTFERTITVYPAKERQEVTIYIPVMIVTVLGIASCFYIWKKV
ncbi:MAG: DUF5011 domain-containing protein [Tenericutes bacterium]|nr:DUF5011 domain-containing protein [Mycoplasmatota bacterium]